MSNSRILDNGHFRIGCLEVPVIEVSILKTTIGDVIRR
jgi:hypothetical protein